MVDTVLEAKIRNLIEEVYCCKCIFPINAKIVDNTYIVYLFIHGLDSHPLHILKDCDNEIEFLTWLEQDLKERNLIRASHININLNHDE